MKVTSGIVGSRLGVRFPGVVVLVSLALGIALALLLIPGTVGAGGPDGFIAPIVLEEGRIAPDVVERPSVPVPQVRTVVEPPSVPVPQVRTEVEPPSVPVPQVRTEVEPPSVPVPQVRTVVEPPSVPVPQVRTDGPQGQGGVGVRQTIPPAKRPVNDNTVNCNADNAFPNEGTYVHTGYYQNTGNPICEYRPRTPGWGYTLCSRAPTWQTVNPATGKAVGGSATKHFSGHYTASGQPICSNFDGLQSTRDYLIEQHKKNHP